MGEPSAAHSDFYATRRSIGECQWRVPTQFHAPTILHALPHCRFRPPPRIIAQDVRLRNVALGRRYGICRPRNYANPDGRLGTRHPTLRQGWPSFFPRCFSAHSCVCCCQGFLAFVFREPHNRSLLDAILSASRRACKKVVSLNFDCVLASLLAQQNSCDTAARF